MKRNIGENMMKKFLIAGVLATTFAATAQAESIKVTVPVIDSQANYVSKNIRTPNQECSVVDVPIYGRTGGGASAGDVLGGMIIGGLIGKGATGKDNGAAAGAVIGGMIAADKNQGQQSIVGYRQEQRCKTTYTYEQVDEVRGYTVTYELDGRKYQTQSTKYIAPGRTLTLRMNVTSVFANP